MPDEINQQRRADEIAQSAVTAAVATSVEHRIEIAAVTIQRQFESIIKLIDQRIDSNREHTTLGIEAQERNALTRFSALTESIDRRFTTVEAQLLIRLEAIDRARDIQAKEYERRLEALNHEHMRLDAMGATYVRSDLYAKDMERLYTERRDQMASAESARRANLGVAATALLAVIGFIVTISLHFVKGGL
jgi:hypothetical protein